MRNETWACFECRLAMRRPMLPHESRHDVIGAGSVSCPKCGDMCGYLGTKVPLPRKSDALGSYSVRALVPAVSRPLVRCTGARSAGGMILNNSFANS